MAYKFQIGAAVLSGSINVAEGAISGSAVSDTLAASIVSEIDAGEIPVAKLAASTISGVSLGSNLASLSKATNGGVNFSSYNGSAAVNNLQLDLSDLAAAAVNVGADSIAIYDADADVTGKETIADLMTAVAGDGLAASSGVLAVGVDDASLEINSDALRVKASGVTNAMLAGSIANAKLSNSTISGVALGANLNSLSKATNGGVNFTSYNGSAAVSNLQLDINDLAAVSIANGDFIAVWDADGDTTGKEAIADVATLFAGAGMTATNSVINVIGSGSLKVGANVVGISGSIAGNGLSAVGGVDSISSLTINANPDSFSVGADGLTLASNVAGAGLALATGQLSVNIDGLSALGGTGLHQTQDHFMFSDNGTEKKITFSNLQDAVFAGVSGDATIAAGGALTIAATSVENGMLAGSIANAKLANSSVTVGGSAVSLGGTITGANIATALNADLGGNFTIGSQSDDMATFKGGVTVEGDLVVVGNTVEVDAAFVVTSSIQFEGTTPDGNELTLTTANPTADRTVTIPDLSGHVPLLAGAISNANVTAAEFALLDGGSSLSTGITINGTTDGFLFNDGGTMKQIRADQVKTYIDSLDVSGSIVNYNQNLVKGVNFAGGDNSAPRTYTLPASPSVGDEVRVKVSNAATHAVTIQRSGAQTIDGSLTSVVLNSDQAAVSFILVASNDWRIF